MAALAALAAALAVVVAPVGKPVAHADAASRGGDFVPFSTARTIWDTRSGAKLKAASTTSFTAVGVGGVPATGVSAVLIRILAVQPSLGTWLTAYPAGTTRPDVSMVNVGTGESLSNTAVVRPGTNGQISLYNRYGELHVVVDVQGYFTTSTGGSYGGFVPVTQRRVLDTTATTIIPAGGSRTVDLAAGGVPAGASAAFVELTVPPGTASGSFTAAPTGVAAGAAAVVHFEDGIYAASGAAVPLTTDTRVTFTNKGPAAAHLLVDIMGYFAKTATAGAGLRPVTARLFGGTVAANGVIDVQVGGANGLPTRGIAGAALSMQAGGGTARGALRAWSTGGVEPGVAHTEYAPGTHHRASVIVKPGTGGKVRIKNYGTASAYVYIDLEGWFSEPQTVIPTVQNTPIRVLQAKVQPGQSEASVEYAFVDNLGKVVVAHQALPGNLFDVQYQTISGNEAFSGPPALTHGTAGTVEVSAQYGDGGDVWASTQTKSAAPTWTAFTDLGGSMAFAPAGADLADGTTVLFAVDADGKLWAFLREGTTPYWRDLGDQDLVGTPATAVVRDGVQVFARTAAGTVKSLVFREDRSVGPWTDLGGALADTPAAVTYPGYRVGLFARAQDGSVVMKKQDAAGVFPAAWTPTGQTGVTGAPAAVIDPVDGRTLIATRDDAGQVAMWGENAAGSETFAPYEGWTGTDVPTVVDPAFGLITSAGGQFWILVYRGVNGTPRIVRKYEGFAMAEQSLPQR
ncbi:PLL family lectin [Actinophytocola sp. KF-1]